MAPGCGPLDKSEGGDHATERAQRREDRICDTAGGGRQEGERCCREMGVSPQAFYSWKRRYAGVGLSELRELRQLREENRKLKGISGGPDLGQTHSAGSAVKKSLKPAARRAPGADIRQAYQLTRKPRLWADGNHALDQTDIKVERIRKGSFVRSCENWPVTGCATDTGG